MKIIVDSNIVFSAMLNKHSVIGDVLLNSQKHFEFYTCEYLREEIANHKSKIIDITGYDELTYHEIEFLIYNQLTFFPKH